MKAIPMIKAATAGTSFVAHDLVPELAVWVGWISDPAMTLVIGKQR